MYNTLNIVGYYDKKKGCEDKKTRISIKFEHVKAHQDIRLSSVALNNQYADRWANKGAAESENETIWSDNSTYSIKSMDETLVRDLETKVSEAAETVEQIITLLIKKTILEIEVSENLDKANKTSTKSTQTVYMERSSRREQNRLLDNANKSEETLTSEAKDTRIVELKLEVAKREERIGSLEERVKGLLKCIFELLCNFFPIALTN